jgi:hypothetical protein
VEGKKRYGSREEGKGRLGIHRITELRKLKTFEKKKVEGR